MIKNFIVSQKPAEGFLEIRDGQTAILAKKKNKQKEKKTLIAPCQ